MIKLNDSLTYRKFVNQRDDALERVLNNSRRRQTEILNQSFINILELVKHRYDLLNVLYSIPSKQRLAHLELEIQREFEHLGINLFNELVTLRKKTYLLSFLGEHRAIQNTTTKNTTPKLTRHELDQKALSANFMGDVDPLRKISFELSKLKQRIINAIELASILGDDTEKALGRIYLALPKTKVLPKKQALKRVKATEADKKKGFEFNFGLEIDPEVWQSLIDDYKQTYIPTDRSPEEYFDIKNPFTGEKITSDIPESEKYYAWEVERDVTNDFVQQVRAGQIEAANQNGVDEFVVISIIDDRTCETCCGKVGCVDFHGKLTTEVEQMTDGEFSAPPYHFNCRCTLAPASKDLEYKPEVTQEDFDQWLNS